MFDVRGGFQIWINQYNLLFLIFLLVLLAFLYLMIIFSMLTFLSFNLIFLQICPGIYLIQQPTLHSFPPTSQPQPPYTPSNYTK